MRVVFAGTPPFAVPALEAILAAGHDVALVLSQPDRAAGRGLKLLPGAVTAFARSRSLRLHQPVALKDAGSQVPIRDAHPDVMVVAAYGLILPQSILDIPARGCLNIHASLLPRWRGAAPIPRAILAGDAETGVAIMRMEAGLDTGPVLLEKRTPIGPCESTTDLTGRLAVLGSQAIVEALAALDRLQPRVQDPQLATYAAKVAKAEARIDWRQPSTVVDRQVRAFNPVPGAEARLNGQSIKVWRASPCAGEGPPGAVLASEGGALQVACGEGALAIRHLQRPGGRRLSAEEFLRGTPIPRGAVLE